MVAAGRLSAAKAQRPPAAATPTPGDGRGPPFQAQGSPLFAEYLEYTYKEDTILAPDGKTKHLLYKLALAELITPTDATNQRTQLKTIE